MTKKRKKQQKIPKWSKGMRITKRKLSFPKKNVYSMLYDRSGNFAIVLKNGRLYMDFGDGINRTKKFKSAKYIDSELRKFGMAGRKYK